MSDFTSTDDWSEIIMRPNTVKALDWVKKNVKFGVRDVGFAFASGYMVKHVLPELKGVGFTIDGDVDIEGRAKIRIRS